MTEARVQQTVNRAWWSLIIRGVVLVLGGLFMIARPMASVAALALVIALWALLQGIITIAHAFDLRRSAQHWWVMLLNGIVGVVFGVAALRYYPILSLSFIVILTSWWLLAGGMMGVAVAEFERRAGMRWGWTMTWGILGVVMSTIAFASPPATLAALMAFLATFGIAAGSLIVVSAIRGRKVTNRVAEEVRHAKAA
jgi:uncharacterized membrane protein HdeD (DUF308 family)